MIRRFFVFLMIGFVGQSWAAQRPEKKSLECYTTKKVIHHNYPEYTLEGENTEVIEYSDKDELKTGPPICVMFYGKNSTHSATWQGHVSSFGMPLDCHINSESFTHCFESPNNFTFLSLPKGWACCCSYNKCNSDNPQFFFFFERNILDASEFLNKIKSLAKVSFCIAFCVFLMVTETILEVLCWKLWGKEKIKKSCELMDASEENEEKLGKNGKPASPGDHLATPLLPGGSLKVQCTQSSPMPVSSKSYKPLSEMTVRQDSSLKVEKTQEDDPELEPASTQKGEDLDDNVPIPPKPEWKKTKTGRIQRTSMNYEESTYSDLQ